MGIERLIDHLDALLMTVGLVVFIAGAAIVFGLGIGMLVAGIAIMVVAFVI